MRAVYNTQICLSLWPHRSSVNKWISKVTAFFFQCYHIVLWFDPLSRYVVFGIQCRHHLIHWRSYVINLELTYWCLQCWFFPKSLIRVTLIFYLSWDFTLLTSVRWHEGMSSPKDSAIRRVDCGVPWPHLILVLLLSWFLSDSSSPQPPWPGCTEVFFGMSEIYDFVFLIHFLKSFVFGKCSFVYQILNS